MGSSIVRPFVVHVSKKENRIPVNYYSAWTGNYVNADSWEDCSPTFRHGVYYV